LSPTRATSPWQTGQANAETILIRASTDPAELAGRVRQLVGAAAGVKVSDIGSAQRLIGSNLTAVDLRGLTQFGIELRHRSRGRLDRSGSRAGAGGEKAQLGHPGRAGREAATTGRVRMERGAGVLIGGGWSAQRSVSAPPWR
jgi:hypothetical protein